MSITPDRPHYAGGAPVPDQVDSSTKEFSRGLDPTTGAKGAEPAEPVPTNVSRNPAGNLNTAGAQVMTLTGDNYGGSTGVTFGGVAGTVFSVVSETEILVTTPARTAGSQPIVVQNPAGNSAPMAATYA